MSTQGARQASLSATAHGKRIQSKANSHDQDVQRRLWAVSEKLTGVTFPRSDVAATKVFGSRCSSYPGTAVSIKHAVAVHIVRGR